MTLYTVVSEKNTKCSPLLAQACSEFGVDYRPIDIAYDFPSDIQTEGPFLMYRISDAPKAFLYEKQLLNTHAVSFYKTPNAMMNEWDNVFSATLIHQSEGIPIPKTIFFSSSKAEKLMSEVESIGGFPVILKVAGGQKGIGVIKVDSFDALQSLIDYLSGEERTFILREFIDSGKPTASYRAIVIGNEVVFSYRNQSVDLNDFRSNTNQFERMRTQISLPVQEQLICIQAVNKIGLNTGAVDFLYRKSGEIAVLEVNFPYNFAPIWEHFQFPIHKKMIEFLVSQVKYD